MRLRNIMQDVLGNLCRVLSRLVKCYELSNINKKFFIVGSGKQVEIQIICIGRSEVLEMLDLYCSKRCEIWFGFRLYFEV